MNNHNEKNDPIYTNWNNCQIDKVDIQYVVRESILTGMHRRKDKLYTDEIFLTHEQGDSIKRLLITPTLNLVSEVLWSELLKRRFRNS